MKVKGDRKHYSFEEAVLVYASGNNVEFGEYVLHEDFTVYHMTDRNRARIMAAAKKLVAEV